MMCGGAAHREPYPRSAALDQVDGYLGAGVADADDEHVPAGVGGRVAVVRGVQELAGVAVAARPVGDPGRVVVAGGDHDRAAGQPASAGGVQQPAPVGGGLDAGDLDAGDDLQLVVLGVLLQIADHVVAGRPAAEAARHRQTGERGAAAGGVQPQPVVVPPPGGADAVGLLQDDRAYAPGAQRGGRGESAGSAAYDVDGAVGGSRACGVGGCSGVGHSTGA
jgi:hypothetical protein